MKSTELQTENSLQKICLYWGIPIQLCNGIRILKLITPPSLPFKLTLFRNSKHSVSIAWGFRIVQYASGTVLIISNLEFGKFDYYLYAPKESEFFEIGKLCVLSAVGIIKEDQGFSRIHAGFYIKDETNHLVFGRSGSGKSTFFANLIKTEALNAKPKIYADELCFMKDGRVYPIPLHIHLKPHQLISLGTVDQNANFELNSICILERSEHQSVTIPLTISEYVKFFFLFLIGDGLHQMAAYHLRLRYIPHWISVFVRRIFVFFKWIRHIRLQKQLIPDTRYLVRS